MTKQYRNFGDKELYSTEYGEHISAMTSEDLRSKSDIALELAGRNIKIKQLSDEVSSLKKALAIEREAFIAWGEAFNQIQEIAKERKAQRK